MTPIKITALDHIVLNVADVERSLKFYIERLGLGGERVDEFRDGNLNHVCLVIGAENFAAAVEYLKANRIEIREGPVSRWGARGQATSVYFLDPDGNTIEIRAY